MNILVISSNYPSPTAPQLGTFVYKLIQQFAETNNVVVISPQKYKLRNKKETFYGDEKAMVYRPKKLSFSNKRIGKLNTFHWSSYSQSRAIKKAFQKIDFIPDVIYCHFIISAINYLKAFPDSKIPVYVAVGEYHNIDVVRSNYSETTYQNFLNKIKGFIAVSPMVRDKLLSLGVSSSKIIVAPNGTDLSKFKPRDKKELRDKYGLPLDKKILLFVGRFIENKGPLRVQEALNSLDDDVVAIFIGKGVQQPSHPKIIFSGSVEHHIVADYMALADVFVLPTLHEGSSNVIIEAMASGLPIVSSDIPEIRVQCKPEYSILVNPMEVDEIAGALNKVLRNNDLRMRMSKQAYEASKSFDLKQRAKLILQFINQ